MGTKRVSKAEEVTEKAILLGDAASNIFHMTEELHALKTAVNAYKVAVKVSADLIKYKEVTGHKKKINFYEG